VNWIWEIEYRCEGLFGKLTYHLPWRERPDLAAVLKKAARELLLMQASDWPFVIARDQAVDYGIKRFMQHAGRFEVLADLAEKLGNDPGYMDRLTDLEKFEIQDSEIHDIVFPAIDLNWWNV
jgi:1,4-alpha-glucan branching enzyme